MSRIGQIMKAVFGWALDEVEESVPLEQRLASDRQERADQFRTMLKRAEDIGAYAELMVQEVARTRIAEQNLADDLKDCVSRAKTARDRGEENAEAEANTQAAQVAQELAQVRADLENLEAQLDEAQETRGLTKAMVLDQARRLKDLAKNDMQLVARVRMTQMKQDILALRESMFQLIPGDNSDMRNRAEERLRLAEAHTKARADLVSTLWADSRHELSSGRTNREGTKLLEEAQREMGYSQQASLPPGKKEEESTS